MQVLILSILSLLSLALIVLVTLQPRQTQIFSSDATSNIGKPSFWSSQPFLKRATVVLSALLIILLLIVMVILYGKS